MKNGIRHTLVAAVAIFSCTLAPVPGPTIPDAAAQATAVPVQSFGASYGEWGARWWQWLLSIPAAVNPNLAQGQVNCGIGQHDTVWFLAGAFGGSVTRTCTIPAGKPVFFPMINAVSFKPKGAETLLDLRAQAAGFVNQVSKLTCTIDGFACADDLFQYRATTPSFTVIPPKGGLLPPGALTVPGNTDSLVADGYWMLLTGLAVGLHQLQFGAETVPGGFTVDVTYWLTVQ